MVRRRDRAGLERLLADNVVFHSPVVHAPQYGKSVTATYLAAAMEVLGNESFRYVREVVGEQDAVLEFEVDIDGVFVNGADLIHWDAYGRITDFKVMVRPFRAVEALRRRMAEALGIGAG